MQYAEIAGHQITMAAGNIEKYLQQKTGTKFVLRSPMLKEGPKIVTAKFMKPSKGPLIDYIPMFILKLEYDNGHDLYNVDTEYWDDMKRGKPVFYWSAKLIGVEQALDPVVVFGFAEKVKERLGKKIGAGETLSANKLKGSASKSEVEVKIHIPKVGKDGKIVDTTKSYYGSDSPIREDDPDAKWAVRRIYLRGPGNNVGFIFYIYKNNQYELIKGKTRSAKVIYSGKMSDPMAPEIIARP